MRGSGGEEEEPSLNRLGTFLQACEQRLAEARRCQAAQDAAKAEAAKEAEEREARERAAEQAARALAAADAKALEEAKKRSQQAYLGYLSAVSRLSLGCISAVSRLPVGYRRACTDSACHTTTTCRRPAPPSLSSSLSLQAATHPLTFSFSSS